MREPGYAAGMQWLARGEPSIPTGQVWLTEAEAGRAAGMRFTKRRTEYLLRRYAGKCAVAAALGLPEDPPTLGRIAVLNAPTGAPFVRLSGERIDTDISLTDRAGWAVCLLGADLRAVGVDLEIVEPRSPGFVRDFLTVAEQRLVAEAAASGQGHAAANLIWSAKEAALKVLRTGLRADTRTVGIELDPSDLTGQGTAPGGSMGAWHRLTADTVIGRLSGWWRRDGLFLLTVVTGGTDSGSPPVTLPGSADLTTAEVIESWRDRPLV